MRKKALFKTYLTVDTHLDVTVVKALCGDSLSLAARSVVVSNGGGGRVAPHALRVASGDVVICLAGGGGRHKILGQDGQLVERLFGRVGVHLRKEFYHFEDRHFTDIANLYHSASHLTLVGARVRVFGFLDG